MSIKPRAIHFNGKTKQSDRYIRKWLQLRTNAYRRGRLVNDEVTPSHLAKIDIDTCPVTLLKLTHGELVESDWSVDRLNNNGAYAIDNLAVISTKANTAKGNKTFEEVLELPNASEPVEGLVPREWLRLACLMHGPSVVEDQARDMLLPLATRLPNQAVFSEWFKLQNSIVQYQMKRPVDWNKQHKELRAISKDAKMQVALDNVFDRLEILCRQVTYPYDAMVDARVQENLQEWFLNIGRTPRTLLRSYLKSAGSNKPFTVNNLNSFSLKTKGYAR